MPVLKHGSETAILRDKETSRTWVVQMDNLKRLLNMRNRMPNALVGNCVG